MAHVYSHGQYDGGDHGGDGDGTGSGDGMQHKLSSQCSPAMAKAHIKKLCLYTPKQATIRRNTHNAMCM